MTQRQAWVLCAVFALLSCAPSSKTPVSVMALLLNSKGQYEPAKVELQTITDIVALQGSAAELRGGAQVVIDTNDPLFQSTNGSLTNEQLPKILLKNEGGRPKAQYIAKNDVLWPADFHSWNMVTAYYAFEQSQLYFQKAWDGTNASSLARPRVLYWAEFIDKQTSSKPLTDNALFFAPVQSFAILPFDRLNKAPLSINLGVIGHEFAHLVFNQKVYGGASIPEPLVTWANLNSAPSANWLKSFDEGLADFHGFGVTCLSATGCNPQFFKQSFNDTVVAERDISAKQQCLTEDLKTAVTSYNLAEFSQKRGLEYRVGTVIAAAFYQAAVKTGQLLNVQKAIVKTYDNAKGFGLKQLLDRSLQAPELFTPEAIADAFLANTENDTLRTELCSELWDRLDLACTTMPCDALPHCPTMTSKGTTCP